MTARNGWSGLRLLAALAALLFTASVASACGSASAASQPSGSGDASELRLGYFANLTHALPVLGVADGQYQQALGGTKLTTQVFNAGPAAVEAVLSGAIDAAYLGPNPAINAYSKSGGEATRIISGATSGGAQFVVKPEVTNDNLKGRTFATPQLGNTQDVALRYWLQQQGLTAPSAGGGDVNVQPMENSTTLTQFKAGDIDGAWLPEPWASRLVLEGGGKVLVDEASLWPSGQFVTTHLIVATPFLQKYPATVSKLLAGQLATQAIIEQDPVSARDRTNAALEQLTGKALAPDVLARAWPTLTVTADPIASSLAADQDHAVSVGLAKAVDLQGIYDLRPLNALLTAAGKPTVSAGGLGAQ